MWTSFYGFDPLSIELRPHTAGSELLELQVLGGGADKVANVVFAVITDRRSRCILSIRDQNTFELDLRKKRLMTLIHLFLIHRYKASSLHFVSPTDDNRYQAAKMSAQGLFARVSDAGDDVIVADVDAAHVEELVQPDRTRLVRLIERADRAAS